MGKEIQLVGETKKIKMPIENLEINMLYTTAYAIFFMAQDAERRLEALNLSLGQNRKMVFKNIVESLKKAQHWQDRLIQDYEDAWKSAPERHDMELHNANALARMLLLWYDRVQGFEGREKEVINFIKNKYPQDIVEDKHLVMFMENKTKKEVEDVLVSGR